MLNPKTAKCFGREKEIGSLEAGRLADVIIFDDHKISHAGSVFRIGAVFSCTPLRVQHSIINGNVVVRDGILETVEEENIVRNQNNTTKELMNST